MSETLKLTPFHDVIASFREGNIVIIADDVDRENEGDLVVATQRLSESSLNFMMNEGRGLICISISVERARKLDLPLQVLNNNSPFGTPFTISVDHKNVVDQGVTTSSRVYTMSKLIDDEAVPGDFTSPGHVFPLIANPAGVIGRQGQTEGSYDLARIAGFEPSGVICEVLNPDGTMARSKELNIFAQKHGLAVTTVEEIIKYRLREEILVREVAHSKLKTRYGEFDTHVFLNDVDGEEHLVLTYGDIYGEKSKGGPLVRIHSECLTGDVITSRRCDCGEQLDFAMRAIVNEGAGILFYLRQEGRGIGLANKLRAYELQDQGLDTVEANLQLGFSADARDYVIAGKILNSFGISSIRLLTNNPKKMDALKKFGISIPKRVPVVVTPDEYSKGYLETKRLKMGHIL